MKARITILALLWFGLTANAQITESSEKTMFWNTLGVSVPLDDKFSISYFQLHSLSLDQPGFNFIQPDLDINYRVTDRLRFSVGFTPTFSIDDNPDNQLVYHRVTGKLRLNTRISRRIRMNNSFTFEHHFTQRSKFQQRYIYRLDLYYRDTSLPWRLRPFVNQKLYYYTNGRPLQYYDDAGNKTDRVSPNGLHAYRVQLGLKLYPIDGLTVTAYYLKQLEFNTSLLGTRDINSLNPNSNNIRRPFYNFSVIGLSLSYSL